MPDKEVMPLKEQIKEALEEYLGYPPDNVPLWVDYALAIEAITDIFEAKEKEWQEKTSKMFNPDYLDFQKGVEATKRLWEADKKEWARKEADWLGKWVKTGFDREMESHIAELNKIAEGK